MGVWGWPPPGTTGFKRGFAASLAHRARSSRCARAEIMRPRAISITTSGGKPQRQATEGDRRRSGALRADDRSEAKGRERPTERSGGVEQRGAGQPRRRREAERRRRRGDGGESPAEPKTKEEGNAQQHKARHAGAATEKERQTNHAAAPPEKKARPRPLALSGGAGKERSGAAASDAAPGAARSDKREGSGCDRPRRSDEPRAGRQRRPPARSAREECDRAKRREPRAVTSQRGVGAAPAASPKRRRAERATAEREGGA